MRHPSSAEGVAHGCPFAPSLRALQEQTWGPGVCSSLFIFCHKWPGRGCWTPPGNIENGSERQVGGARANGDRKELEERAWGRGEGRLRVGLPPAEPAHSGCGYPPTCRGSLRVGFEGGGPKLPGSSPGSWQGPKSFPNVDEAGGSASSRTDRHAHRLAEELLPLARALPSPSAREWALKAGGPRSSSWGGVERRLGHQCPFPPQG